MADHEKQEESQQPYIKMVSSTSTLNNHLLRVRDGYQETRQALIDLLSLEEDEEYVRPTKYAFDLALELIETCKNELLSQREIFPRGSSSTSEKGGLYLFWEGEEGSIQLTVPAAEGGMYSIHVLHAGQSFLIRDVTPQKLTEELASFNRRHLSMQGYTNAPASAVA